MENQRIKQKKKVGRTDEAKKGKAKDGTGSDQWNRSQENCTIAISTHKMLKKDLGRLPLPIAVTAVLSRVLSDNQWHSSTAPGLVQAAVVETVVEGGEGGRRGVQVNSAKHNQKRASGRATVASRQNHEAEKGNSRGKQKLTVSRAWSTPPGPPRHQTPQCWTGT